MDEDDAPPKKQAAGAPAWTVTFSDLMSLLLAFFVLLFSFSEIDKQKFKELAGSLREAFGVQNEVRVRDTPVGNNIIAREFSPGKPQPTVLNQVRQTLPNAALAKKQAIEQEHERVRKEVKANADKIRQLLKDEIQSGSVEVLDDGNRRVIIRILERGSFPSGGADLNMGFLPVLGKIGNVLSGMEGRIIVAGHTDNVPIHTARYRSNWELSASRAVTVLQQIQDAAGLPNSRFRLEGYGDTVPVNSNDSAADRARNRRVEVILIQGQDQPPTDAAESILPKLDLPISAVP